MAGNFWGRRRPSHSAGGSSEPVAITLAVPPDASAAEPDEVTLTAVGGGNQASAAVRIDIARHLDLRLDVPKQVAVGEYLVVTVQNAGNVATTANIRVTAGNALVGNKTLTVGAGKKATASFPASQEAQYQVRLERDGVVLAVRYVNTVVHGAPKPSTFTLSGTAYASLTSDLAWQTSVDLKGQVSDYTELALALRAERPLASYLQLRSERFAVRVGDLSSESLPLPSLGGFGISAIATPPSMALEGGAAWLGTDQFTGRFAVGYRRSLQDVSLVGGVGMRSGSLTVAGTMQGDIEGGRASLAASYDGQRLAASFGMNAHDATGSYHVSASLNDGLTEYGRFSASASYWVGHTNAYVSGTAALGSQAASQVQTGASTRLASVGSADLEASLVLGAPESRVTVTYLPGVQGNIRPTADGGVVYRTDGLGWGVSADTRVGFGHSDGRPGWNGSLEARGRYFPTTDVLQGRLSARALGTIPPLTLFASSGWDLGTGTVGLNTGAIFNSGDWTLQGNVGGTYAPGSIMPWSAQLQVQARIAFDLGVPDGIVQLTGGRRLGTLKVHVNADGKPIPGVGLAVGRYRLATGSDGSIVVRLPPSTITVGVDLTKLAFNLQLVGNSTRSVTLRDGATSEVTFNLRRTSAVRGQVLVDANGDGLADPGAGGVEVSLLVEDALGQGHAVTTAPNGSYVVRGLPAGTTTVAVVDTPHGAAVVGSSKHTVNLSAGGTGVADFLIQPAVSRATVFGGDELRIRDIVPELGAVPPGSAPLVTITTVGRPESVVVVAGATTYKAKRVETGQWLVRVPVRQDTRGIERFEVRATKGTKTVHRAEQFIVDPTVPLVGVTPLGVVRPGTSIHVHVHVLLEVTTVTASLDGGVDSTTLTQTAPGTWQGDLPVPAEAKLVSTTCASRQADPMSPPGQRRSGSASKHRSWQDWCSAPGWMSWVSLSVRNQGDVTE